jgi:hypothetical protein
MVNRLNRQENDKPPGRQVYKEKKEKSFLFCFMQRISLAPRRFVAHFASWRFNPHLAVNFS